jgi:hypothetical protein
MFTSKQFLSEHLGVDAEIAAFFVDRAVPKDNVYWQRRHLYVARGNGFLFIPLFFDLQLRAGAHLKRLLDEDYVQLMERIMDVAGRYELQQIDFTAHIAEIDQLVANRVVQPTLRHLLKQYFSTHPPTPIANLGTGNNPLNRGDALLYLLTALPAGEAVVEKIISYWYLLVPSFLLMDDIMDLHEDQEKNEENGLSHFGYDAAGVKKAMDFLDKNFQQMELINPLLSAYFRKSLEDDKTSTYFKMILNSGDGT